MPRSVFERLRGLVDPNHMLKMCIAHSKLLKGVLLGCLASFLFSITGMLTKTACKNGVPIFNLLVVRLCVQSVLCTAVGIWKRVTPAPLRTRVAPMIFTRAACLVVSHFTYYIAVSRLPLGDAAALMLTSTVWASVLGAIFLRERLGIMWIMCVVSGVGVLLIAKPGELEPLLGGSASEVTEASSFEVEIIASIGRNVAIAVTCISALFNGLAFVTGRYVVTRTDPLLSLIVFTYMAFVVSLLLCLTLSPFDRAAFEQLDPMKWFLMLLLPCTCFGGQIATLFALKFESAAIVAVLSNLDCAFSYIFQLALGDGFNAWSLVGAGLIVSASLAFAVAKLRRARKESRLALSDTHLASETKEEDSTRNDECADNNSSNSSAFRCEDINAVDIEISHPCVDAKVEHNNSKKLSIVSGVGSTVSGP